MFFGQRHAPCRSPLDGSSRLKLSGSAMPGLHATACCHADQARQAGGSAAGVAIGRAYKGNPLPAAAVNLKNAGTTVSRNYITGTVDGLVQAWSLSGHQIAWVM